MEAVYAARGPIRIGNAEDFLGDIYRVKRPG